MKKVLLFAIIIFIMFACSKKTQSENEITVFNNSAKPHNPNYSIEVIEQKTLQNDSSRMLFDMPWDVTEDKEGNVFILSLINCKIIKYDKELNYLCEFGGQGDGPGELSNPQSMFISVDTLFVSDTATKKINRFSLNGQFFNSFLAPEISQAHSFIGRNEYFISQSISMYEKNGVMLGRSKLTLLDKDFNLIKDIYDGGETEDFIFFKTRISYAMTNNNIFVAENRTDRYKITIFDFKGINTGVINKNYAMITFEYKKDTWSKFFKSNYKRSISNLYTDYKENIWVMKAQADPPDKNNHREPFKFDVFKDGLFVNEIVMDSIEYEPFDYGLRTKVVNDRIYSLYGSEDKVVVSKYVIKD